MIRRLLSGLAALLLLVLGLGGLPAFLLGAYTALDAQMPDLVDLPGVLLAPGDGGLFLLLLFAIGWVCWAVLAAAFTVEVIARARGVRTPHLGAFFPQATIARSVSAVALMLTLTPVTAHALPAATTSTVAAPAATTTATTAAPAAAAARDQRAADQADDEDHRDYVVEGGDTLWDIADDQLDDPVRYPEIVQASQGITQPDGRHLTDPDLILPGWTLHVPTDQAETAEAAPPVNEPVSEAEPVEVPSPASAEDSPNPGEQVVPPPTPLSAPASPASTPTRGGPALPAAAGAPPVTPALPVTPMNATGGPPVDQPDMVTAREAGYDDEGRFAPTHGVLGLPNWITAPLLPTRPEDAPELIAEAEAILARHSAKRPAARDADRLPHTPQGRQPR